MFQAFKVWLLVLFIVVAAFTFMGGLFRHRTPGPSLHRLSPLPSPLPFFTLPGPEGGQWGPASLSQALVPSALFSFPAAQHVLAARPGATSPLLPACGGLFSSPLRAPPSPPFCLSPCSAPSPTGLCTPPFPPLLPHLPPGPTPFPHCVGIPAGQPGPVRARPALASGQRLLASRPPGSAHRPRFSKGLREVL